MDKDQQSTSEGKPSSSAAEEWKELFQKFHDQVRREAARSAGVDENADWETIGRHTSEATRKGTAEALGLQEDANWEQIGKHLERTTRSGVSRFVGTAPDADWATIGQTVDQKVRQFLQDLFAPKKPSETTKKDDMVDPWQ